MNGWMVAVIVVSVLFAAAMVVLSVVVFVYYLPRQHHTNKHNLPGKPEDKTSIVTFSKLGDMGNMGNQLFQIAATVGMARRNNRSYAFPATVKNLPVYRLCELDGLPLVVRDLRPNQIQVVEERFPFHQDHLRFSKDVSNNRAVDLRGFWQNPRYWTEDDDKLLRKLFTVRPHLMQRVRDEMPEAFSPNSVAIHVRRGDYTRGDQLKRYTQCSQAYYQKGLSYILQHLGSAVGAEGNFTGTAPVIVFSDDIPGLKKQGFLDETVVSSLQTTDNRPVSLHWSPFSTDAGRFSESDSQLLDFVAMSQCQHMVGANSSYSWWAAWFKRAAADNGPPRRVVMPSPWYKTDGDLAHANTPDIYLPLWQVLSASDGSRPGSARLSQIFADSVPAVGHGSLPNNEQFGPVFVISLATEKQRLDSAQGLLKSVGLLSIPFQAVVPVKEDRKQLQRQDVLATNDEVDSEGTLGCALSHYAIYNYIVDNGIEMATVFEDDIQTYIDADKLRSEMQRMLSVIPAQQWDIIFLGRCWDRCDKYKKIDKGIYQTFQPLCTHAYVMHHRGAEKLLRKRIYSGVDTIIRDMCTSGTLKAYTFHPSIFVQDILEWKSNLRNFEKQIGNAADCALLTGAAGVLLQKCTLHQWDGFGAV